MAQNKKHSCQHQGSPQLCLPPELLTSSSPPRLYRGPSEATSKCCVMGLHPTCEMGLHAHICRHTRTLLPWGRTTVLTGQRRNENQGSSPLLPHKPLCAPLSYHLSPMPPASVFVMDVYWLIPLQQTTRQKALPKSSDALTTRTAAALPKKPAGRCVHPGTSGYSMGGEHKPLQMDTLLPLEILPGSNAPALPDIQAGFSLDRSFTAMSPSQKV